MKLVQGVTIIMQLTRIAIISETPQYLFSTSPSLHTRAGDCDETSACQNTNICHHNHTGCPVSGGHRLSLPNTPCQDCPEGEGEDGEGEETYDAMVMTLLVVVLLTVLVGVVFTCAISFIRRSPIKR